MTRTNFQDLKARKLAAMTPEDRAIFDETYEAARLAIEVGEKVRDAREAAGFSQRELASRMGTSQAAVARLEAGGTGATLTTLQKVAGALDLKFVAIARSIEPLFSDARVRILPDTGHDPTLERPRELAALIMENAR